VVAPVARILIVEDTPTQAEVARALLRDLGHEIRVAETGAAAVAEALAWRPDAILMDIELPDFSGFEAMRRLRAEGLESAIIVVTAHGSVNHAVEAMREGAVDFILKPFAKARLTVTLQNALEKRALVTELAEVRAQLSRDRFFGFIGASAAMQAVYRTIESVAASRANVFITGESGTGKELAAEAVHKASPRGAKPFVALNCAAIPRDLLESEVFGHERGAFTGAAERRIGAAERAGAGTLLLDEIAELDFALQAKLLRLLEDRRFLRVGGAKELPLAARIVAATNADLAARVAEGRFRGDLYWRLAVVELRVPPLRERPEDVPVLAAACLHEAAASAGRGGLAFAPEAEAALLAHGWPGNVRELRNRVTRAALLAAGPFITRADLFPDQPGAAEAPPQMALSAIRDAAEREHVRRVLLHCGGRVGAAARLLAISRTTLWERMRRLGLSGAN